MLVLTMSVVIAMIAIMVMVMVVIIAVFALRFVAPVIGHDARRQRQQSGED